ncbi:MAG: DNA-3-methyladenine glycosylase [Pseudomonadota bacterium]
MAQIVSLTEQYGLGSTRHGSVFEVLARSIASQQLSGLVAGRILDRLVLAHDGRFPSPGQIVSARAEDLRAIGFSFAKIAALKDLAAHSLDGRLPSDAELALLDDEAVIGHCVAVRGIGRWTAQMLLMFHLGREDVLPVDDYGVRNGFRLAYGLKGLPRPKSLDRWGERWRPHRSAAAWYLWRAVDLKQQGLLPKRPGRSPRIEVVPASAPKKKKAKKKKTGKRHPSRRATSARRR